MSAKCVIAKLTPTGEIATKRSLVPRPFALAMITTRDTLEGCIRGVYKLPGTTTMEVMVGGIAVPTEDLISEVRQFIAGGEQPWFELGQDANGRHVVEAEVSVLCSQLWLMRVYTLTQLSCIDRLRGYS